ncbi:uncharacterized protein LOC113792546 [Dermatophagoides pteronyssinus]|uniref:uncharacterized protein LOC113792546 n=1 Tax=Dermatophagoides pteronyssinus TaxID=6956 RepID=UPI003F66F61D
MLPVPKFLQKNQNDEQNMNHNQGWQSSHKTNGNNFQRPIRNFNNYGKRKCNQNSINIQCDFDDCRFQSANKDEMLMHKKINHFQLCSRFNDGFLMDSPEEISKWRNERRSKYPRLSNIINNDDNDINHIKNNQPNRNHNNSAYRNNNYRDRRKFQRHSFSYSQKNHSNNRIHKRNSIENKQKNSTVKSSLPITPEPSSSSSSLNLISGYCSGSNSEHSDNEESKQNEHKILSSMIDELIEKVEKTKIVPKKLNKTISNKKQKPTIQRQPLQYSNLNLFQKLMLQDVRRIKSELLQSLKLLVDTNFLETN